LEYARGPTGTRWNRSDVLDQPRVDAQCTLIAGFSNVGLAGLTAADFLVDQLGLEETGHVSVDQLPAITPFEQGRPRHHARFFSKQGLGATVSTGELFVPLFAAGAFSDAVLDWLEESGVSEVTVLAGLPVPHGPEDHRTFYVATDDYRDGASRTVRSRRWGTAFSTA